MLQIADQRDIGIWLMRIFTTFGWKELILATPFFSDVEILGRGPVSFYISRLAKTAEVFLITKPPKSHTQKKLIRILSLSGVKVYLNELLHAKIIVAKRSPLSGLVIIGSANLTIGGLYRNMELALITDDQNVLQDLNTELDRIKIKSKEADEFHEA